MHRRHPLRPLLAVVGTLALAASAFAAADQVLDVEVAGTPVDGSIQQAYVPMEIQGKAALDALGQRPANQEIALPEGIEPLTLQAADIGMTALEPTLGVTSDGTAFFAGSELAADAGFTWGGGKTTTLRSTDGGLTWEDVQNKIPVAEVPLSPVNADPMVYVDEMTDRVFNLDLYAGCSWANFSDDNAETWTPSPAACGDMVNDHQTIIAGPVPPDPLTTPAPGAVPYTDDEGNARYLYYCFNRVIDSSCGRSADGGLTWHKTGGTALEGYRPSYGLCSSLHGHIDTDPEGRLFLPTGQCGLAEISISTDGADSWHQLQVSDIPASDSHLSVASDAAGNLYFVWWDANYRLPFLSVSTDHGETWSTPRMIAPPGVTEVNFPVIDAGDEGRIAIAFPGTTGDPEDGNRPWNHYVVVSTDALSPDGLFLSATANAPDAPVHRGNCDGRCAGLWDFQDLVVAPSGEAWAAVADDCLMLCERGAGQAEHAGRGVAIRQIGGPLLRAEPLRAAD